MNKIVLITGATSGIGKSCAEKFATSGYDVIITGRRLDRLNDLKIQLENDYKIKVMLCCFDVQDRAAVLSAINQLPDEWKKIDLLINNAGLALGKDSFEDANLDDWDTMMHTNVDGLLYVSKAILPYMIANKKGHIINIGSIAGKEVYENGNVYCATKAAVDSLTKSMWIDLLPYGIKVSQIAPGAVETEFSSVRFGGDEVRAKSVYKGFVPLQAEDVADVIHYAASLPAHVNINDLLLMPAAQASATIIQRDI